MIDRDENFENHKNLFIISECLFWKIKFLFNVIKTFTRYQGFFGIKDTLLRPKIVFN